MTGAYIAPSASWAKLSALLRRALMELHATFPGPPMNRRDRRLSSLKWRTQNPEAARAITRRYYYAHRETLIAKRQEYRRTHTMSRLREREYQRQRQGLGKIADRMAGVAVVLRVQWRYPSQRYKRTKVHVLDKHGHTLCGKTVPEKREVVARDAEITCVKCRQGYEDARLLGLLDERNVLDQAIAEYLARGKTITKLPPQVAATRQGVAHVGPARSTLDMVRGFHEL